jgi:hypothetical protein
MRTGYSACSDSFAIEQPIVELLPIHVLAEDIISGSKFSDDNRQSIA